MVSVRSTKTLQSSNMGIVSGLAFCLQRKVSRRHWGRYHFFWIHCRRRFAPLQRSGEFRHYALSYNYPWVRRFFEKRVIGFFSSRARNRGCTFTSTAETARRSSGLEPHIELANNFRLSRSQLQEIEQIIEVHHDELKRAWHEHSPRLKSPTFRITVCGFWLAATSHSCRMKIFRGSRMYRWEKSWTLKSRRRGTTTGRIWMSIWPKK